jgi:glycosyltransferase involved in cell wall biosynthesis
MNRFDGIKIALGYEIREGPWGGGNQFLRSFKNYFENLGAIITHHLEGEVNLIIIINPRSGTFSIKDLKKYKRRYPKVKIIHRVNETDKAKNTSQIDKLRLEANECSDAVVFVSEWVKDYYLGKGFNGRTPYTIIRSGADESIFNSRGYRPWQKGTPLKIVTHHWSDNLMKGADIYQSFDGLLENPWMRERFEFTYIGRAPVGTKFRFARLLSPLSGETLAREIKDHHVYLTAARWEACAMHPLEGAACGLPLLFIDEGGGVLECCRGFGLEFSANSFAAALFEMLDKYHGFQEKMPEFPYNAAQMNKRYEQLISDLLGIIDGGGNG